METKEEEDCFFSVTYQQRRLLNYAVDRMVQWLVRIFQSQVYTMWN